MTQIQVPISGGIKSSDRPMWREQYSDQGHDQKCPKHWTVYESYSEEKIMKAKTAKKRKPKNTESKDFNIAPKSEDVEAEYTQMYERWDAQHLAYSDLDLHY